MEGDNKDLTQEELLAQEELDKKKGVELTEEQIEEIVKKKFGVGSAELIKKQDQVKVLTDAEKAELEEKKNTDVLKLAFEENWFTKKEYDAYLEAKGTDEISLVKKKFIDDNPELGKDAENIFNAIFKIDEDDDIEDGENTKPNMDKKAAKALAKKIADTEINSKYGKIINASTKYEQRQAEIALNKQNAELVEKAVSEIPKRLEVKVGDKSYGVDMTDEDYQEAKKLAFEGVKGRKDVKPEEIRENAFLYMRTKNFERLFEEAITNAIEEAVDAAKRGGKGLIEKEVKGQTSTELREFLKKKGISV
jgi:hypothetical protein